MRKPHKSIPKNEVDQVVADYLNGTHTTELAKRYDVTQPTVVYLLRKRRIPRRSRSETNRMRAPVDRDVLLQLVEEAQRSQREIAEYLGVSLPTVERALRQLRVRSKRGRGAPLERNYFWRGGQRTDRDRYVMVKVPDHPHATKDGYVRQHRLVMEKVLGRYLLPTEEVHHKDGDPTNNDPSNLLVFASHADHLRYEWRERWSKNFPPKQADRQLPALLLALPSPVALGNDAEP